MKTYKLLLALAITLALSLTAIAQTSTVPELKGDKLGNTLKQWCTNHNISRPWGISTITKQYELVVMSVPEIGNAITIAGMNAKTMYVFKLNHQEKMDSTLYCIRAAFGATAAPSVLLGLTEKYGKPTEATKVQLRTRMNLAVESIHYTWNLPDNNQIILETIGDDIESATLTMTDLTVMSEVMTLKTKAASTDI